MTTLAIDLGTSAVKLLRADATLRILSADRVPQATIDVDAWIECLRQNIQAHGDGGAIERIAITGQMHGLVTLEDDGYGQGIPWTDQRGTDVLPDLLGNLDPAHITRIGGPLASGFQAVSLAWMRVYEPGRWTRSASLAHGCRGSCRPGQKSGRFGRNWHLHSDSGAARRSSSPVGMRRWGQPGPG